MSLRMSDDRLCQDCDDSNTAACADLRNRDVEHTSPTSPTQSQANATASDSTTATGTLNNNKSAVNNNGVIIDELLCFVKNKIDILPPISICVRRRSPSTTSRRLSVGFSSSVLTTAALACANVSARNGACKTSTISSVCCRRKALTPPHLWPSTSRNSPRSHLTASTCQPC